VGDQDRRAGTVKEKRGTSIDDVQGQRGMRVKYGPREPKCMNATGGTIEAGMNAKGLDQVGNMPFASSWIFGRADERGPKGVGRGLPSWHLGPNRNPEGSLAKWR
jgi:hypothetical protein